MSDTALIVSEFLMGYQPNTRITYRQALDEFADHYDGALLEATRPDVQRWLMHLVEDLGRAPSTVRKKTSALSAFYDYAVQEGHLEHNPCEHVRRPQGESEVRRGLDLEDAGRVIDAAWAHSRSAHALVWLMAGAGLRVSEACNALIEDLDADRALLTVTVKRGDRQTKPLSEPVLEAVTTQIDGRTAGRILTNHDGQPLSRHRAWELVEKLASQADVECTPHTLRHTAATLALELGVPIQDVQQLLGHKSIETTLLYVRNRDILGATRSAAGRLGEALANARRRTINWNDISGCKAATDGECNWPDCPQLRDGEPEATGRHCPLDQASEQDE